jgi:hypothetical protein
VRYLLLCLLIACSGSGIAADDYNPDTSYGTATPPPETTVATPPVPVLCATGNYAATFQPSSQSLTYGWCTGSPETYGITMSSTIDILGCNATLISGNEKTCTFENATCTPTFGNEQLVWDGQIVFAYYIGRVFVKEVNGILVYSEYTGMIGVGSVFVKDSLCSYDILIVPGD